MSMPVQIPAHELFRYIILVLLIMKRIVREKILPELNEWSQQYGVAHVEVGNPSGDFATMWSNMWSEAEESAKAILGQRALTDITVSDPKVVDAFVQEFLKEESWIKTQYFWFEILSPYVVEFSRALQKMEPELFTVRLYEPLNNKTAGDFLARMWTFAPDEPWSELCQQVVVAFLYDAYPSINREAGENHMNSHYMAILMRKAMEIIGEVDFLNPFDLEPPCVTY